MYKFYRLILKVDNEKLVSHFRITYLGGGNFVSHFLIEFHHV